jgi:hypothetical protein
VKTKKRESDHFICEAPHLSDASMTSILQRAEHTYAMFHKMFNQTDLFKGVKLTLLVLKDTAQHDRYVDNAYKGDPAKMQLLHECRCTGGFPYMEIYQETASDDLPLRLDDPHGDPGPHGGLVRRTSAGSSKAWRSTSAA